MVPARLDRLLGYGLLKLIVHSLKAAEVTSLHYELVIRVL